jgi:hypothetical protein
VANGKGPAPGASTITQQVKEYSNKAVVSVLDPISHWRHISAGGTH